MFPFPLVELGAAGGGHWVLFLPGRFLSWVLSSSSRFFVVRQLPADLPEAALTNMSDVSSNFP